MEYVNEDFKPKTKYFVDRMSITNDWVNIESNMDDSRSDS